MALLLIFTEFKFLSLESFLRFDQKKKKWDFISRRIPTNTLAVYYLRVMLSVAQEYFPIIGGNNWLGYLLDLRAQRPELSERIIPV